MRKTSIRIATITLCTIASTLSAVGFTATDEGNFTTLGPGVDSCGKFINAANKGSNQGEWGDWNKYALYAQGYITGINELLNDTRDIRGNTDMEGIMGAVENYCRKNPTKSFYSALSYTLDELYADRLKN